MVFYGFFLSFFLKLSRFLNTKVQFCCWALPWICLFAKFCILFLSVICDKWFHFVLVLDLLEGEHFRPRLLFFLIKTESSRTKLWWKQAEFAKFFAFHQTSLWRDPFFFFHWNSSLNLVRQHLSFSLCSRILLKPS